MGNGDNAGPGSSSFAAVSAAAYVRMSTDHQKYSTDNQLKAIGEYAAKNGLEIVKVYADEGKSGVSATGRDAFKEMLDDVIGGNVAYQVLLVYDVSRWGRFQDKDEAGYYRYQCKRCGIKIHFCAEEFKNDGSMASSIVLTMKDIMAGEYSRQLSEKVFRGQCRLVLEGYKMGGPAGYGLRRLMIDEHGNPKSPMQQGQRKSFQTDRVILVPGPEEEVLVVNHIYRWFIREKIVETQIANRLNKMGVKTDFDRSWSRGTVHQVLTNPKYVGHNVFNRTSSKLKSPSRKNKPEEWVIQQGAFKAIVDPGDFLAAKEIINERSRRLTDEDMLRQLKLLFEKSGRLSGMLIDETDGMPSSCAYKSRFGSILRAYTLIGYRPDIDYSFIETNKRIREMHPGVIHSIANQIEMHGGTAEYENSTGILLVNREFTSSLVISRCRQTRAGSNQWLLRFNRSQSPDIIIVIRLATNNVSVKDYYLLPSLEILENKIRLAGNNGAALDTYRYDDLHFYTYLSERVGIENASREAA